MTFYAYYVNIFSQDLSSVVKSLKITEKSPTYINEDFAWNETPYDVLGLCYFYVDDKSKAYAYYVNIFSQDLSSVVKY